MRATSTRTPVSPCPRPAARAVCPGSGVGAEEDELDTGIEDLGISLQQPSVWAPTSPSVSYGLPPLGVSRAAPSLHVAPRALRSPALSSAASLVSARRVPPPGTSLAPHAPRGRPWLAHAVYRVGSSFPG